MVVFKTAMKQLTEQIAWRRRKPHPELGVPVPTYGPQPKVRGVDEKKLLRILAEDYRVNPGLLHDEGRSEGSMRCHRRSSR